MLSKVRYCNNCNQTVEPKKNVSVIALVLLLLFLILPGIIYLIYCLVQKGKCPICNSTNWRNVGSPPKVMKKAYREYGTSAEEDWRKKEAAKIKEELANVKEEAAKIKEEAAKKSYEEGLEKQLIEEDEEKKTRVKISPKERLKNSPGLQGMLIGLVAVVVLLGIISLSTTQDTFYMNNNALSPDVNQGDLLHYQKTPLMEIKKNDIIAFVDPDGEVAAKVGKVREVGKDGDSFFFKTSSNAAPSNYSTITSENFIGKITSIEPTGSWEDSVLYYSVPTELWIAAFVAPIIILKVRKRLQN